MESEVSSPLKLFDQMNGLERKTRAAITLPESDPTGLLSVIRANSVLVIKAPRA